MRLILHIGWPRTGTTSIQQYLSRSSKKLLDLGLCYPVAGRPLKEKGGIGHHAFAWSLKGQRPSWADTPLREPADIFHEMTAEAAGRDIVLSAEGLTALDSSAVEKLSAMAAGFDVSVICYVRRPEKMIPSWYSLFVRSSGMHAAFNEKDLGPAYATLLQGTAAWRQVFDTEMKVFDYDLCGDTAAHFFRAAGIDIPVLPRRSNASADWRLVEAFRLINERVKIPAPERRALYKAIENAFRQEQPDHSEMLKGYAERYGSEFESLIDPIPAAAATKPLSPS